MKLSSVIVEDIQVAADFLKKFCEKSGFVEVKAHFTNVAEALTYLDQQEVDLIFLDVEMPGATGFDLLDHLTFSPRIILTTSKTEYAYDAFQYHVNAFLKKPFTYKQFMNVMEKIHTQPLAQRSSAVEPDHFFIKVDGKLVKLQNHDILFIESMGDYVRFVTQDKKYVTLNTLKNLEEKMDKNAFIKVHRSYIVNIPKIDDLQGNIIYIKGHQIPIGKGHREEVIKHLNII